MPRPEAYPDLPEKHRLSEPLCASIVQEADSLMAGEWVLFREISLDVDVPPKWQKDYISGEEITDHRPFRKLNHRTLKTADIKVVWDLNRWTQLVRIAQAAYVTGDPRYRDAVTALLDDWVRVNPPFTGWNWTSSLESAIRLIHFAWIECLLQNQVDEALRNAIVTCHFRYTWRHRSFGSSANNHWLGELSALIVAKCRWRNLENCGPTVDKLKSLFEKEILSQFSTDGGNKEQAFHYHIFSFEFIIHAYYSLVKYGFEFSGSVIERIESAAEFLVNMQTPDFRWDFGDSDDAVLVPFGTRIPTSLHSWKDWLEPRSKTSGPSQWLGETPFVVSKPAQGWYVAKTSGYAVFRDDDWFVRVDGSPLGYLSLAAHGHLDAMHVSFWYRSRAMIVDSGTGAYYYDVQARERLAGELSHNGPVVGDKPLASRVGVFLWADHHPVPSIRQGDARDVFVRSDHHEVFRRRRVVPKVSGWIVEDEVRSPGPVRVSVAWHFAPEVLVEQVDTHEFRLRSGDAVLWFAVDRSWREVRLDDSSQVSPSFRNVGIGSAVKLLGESNRPSPFITVLGSRR